jgi:hypothetical protein
MPVDTAMVSTPPLEHEGYLSGRCPPEESRIHASHVPTIEQHSPEMSDDGTELNAPAQLPTPPPTEREPPPRALSPPDSHTKPSEMRIDDPIRDIPTPVSATDDGAEERRVAQASPLSATTLTTITWSQHKLLTSPHPSHRVRITSAAAIRPARTRSRC